MIDCLLPIDKRITDTTALVEIFLCTTTWNDFLIKELLACPAWSPKENFVERICMLLIVCSSQTTKGNLFLCTLMYHHECHFLRSSSLSRSPRWQLFLMRQRIDMISQKGSCAVSGPPPTSYKDLWANQTNCYYIWIKERRGPRDSNRPFTYYGITNVLSAITILSAQSGSTTKRPHSNLHGRAPRMHKDEKRPKDIELMLVRWQDKKLQMVWQSLGAILVLPLVYREEWLSVRFMVEWLYVCPLTNHWRTCECPHEDDGLKTVNPALVSLYRFVWTPFASKSSILVSDFIVDDDKDLPQRRMK